MVLLRYIPDGVIAHLHPSWWIFADRSDPLNGFGATAAFVLALLLVFGLVGGWLLAGRMLAPLTRITEATRVAATGALSHRIRLPGRNDEFRELADSFDAMLARLEAQVAEQQRFAANASHELRTPLATTQTLLEVARNDPECDTDELVDRLHAVNARAIDLTEALLVLSRADQRSFTREPVDLSLVAEEATETLARPRRTTRRHHRDLGRDEPHHRLHALLLQLTTNLVHNGIVHNLPDRRHGVGHDPRAAPTGWCSRSRTPAQPLTPQEVSTFAEPFQRGSRTHPHGSRRGRPRLGDRREHRRAHDGTLTVPPGTPAVSASPCDSPRGRHEWWIGSVDRREALQLRELRDREAFGVRRADERTVTSDQDDIGIVHSECRREVDCVVAAQRMFLSFLTSEVSEGIVDLDEVHLLEPGVRAR